MAAQQHFDEYKISTMHCGGNSLAIVHKVHYRWLVSSRQSSGDDIDSTNHRLAKQVMYDSLFGLISAENVVNEVVVATYNDRG